MEENTIYDYSILKGKIVEKIGSRRELAEKLGINETTLSNKLNNKTDFSREEMKKICKILDEPLIKIIEYFFTEAVRENEQKNKKGMIFMKKFKNAELHTKFKGGKEKWN